MLLFGMRSVLALLLEQDDRVPLDAAALALATIEFPRLDPAPSLLLLDEYAAAIARRLPPAPDGATFVATANQYLFNELGFAGNTDDYYDPLNSCLNEVLRRRTGLPISLAVVYIEIARRLGQPVFGIGLPGHFLVQYRSPSYAPFIDPYHTGQLLTESECVALARRLANVDVSLDPTGLEPVTKRQILLRMLNNLRNVYFQRQSLEKATKVLDLLVQVYPENPTEYRQRAVIALQMKRYQNAQRDFMTYLRLAPGAPDRAEIQEQLTRLRQWHVNWN